MPVKLNDASVPTDVRDEVRTVAASAVPVKVLAAAETVIAAEPSKFTPLIARGVVSVFAVVAVVAFETVLVVVARVPLVGNVMFVAAVAVMVTGNAPTCVRAEP